MNIKASIRFRRIFNYFLGGLLITLPIFGTGYVLYTAFHLIDGLIDTQFLFGLNIPGLGVLVVLSVITLIGYIGKGLFTKPLIDLFDHILEKIPGIKVIYSMLKDFIEAFVGEKKKFTEGVAVELNNGVYKLGFVTTKDLKLIEMEGFVAVYFPHSYNFSGNLFLVPKEKIKPLNGNSSELMKFIVSGGVTGLDSMEATANKKKQE
jgi:uncharacterized membrane protein